MSAIQSLESIAARYLASPSGQKLIREYLSSPEGQASIDAFLATPRGQQMAFLLLSRALNDLDLPPEVKSVIRNAITEHERSLGQGSS